MTHTIAQSDYMDLASAKLIEIKEKAHIVETKLLNEIADGKRFDCEQLQRSKQQVEHFMSTAQQKLDDLQAAEGEQWEMAKDAFNSAWEDVAQSMRQAVARFS